jgi:hypothetical protein
VDPDVELWKQVSILFGLLILNLTICLQTIRFYDLHDVPIGTSIDEVEATRPNYWYQCLPTEIRNPFLKSCDRCQVDSNIEDIDRQVRRMELSMAYTAQKSRIQQRQEEYRKELEENAKRMILLGKDFMPGGPR